MKFGEVSITSAASLVCLLLVTCNSFVHQTTARHINASFRTIKFNNILQIAGELKKLADDTIKEIKTKTLFGYQSLKGYQYDCKLAATKSNTTSEEENLRKTKAMILAFAEAFKNVTTAMTGQPKAQQSFNNVILLRHKIVDWDSTIGYVEKQLHYGVSKTNHTNGGQIFYSKPSDTNLGNKIISFLSQCFEIELAYSMTVYQDMLKKLSKTNSTFR